MAILRLESGYPVVTDDGEQGMYMRFKSVYQDPSLGEVDELDGAMLVIGQCVTLDMYNELISFYDMVPFDEALHAESVPLYDEYGEVVRKGTYQSFKEGDLLYDVDVFLLDERITLNMDTARAVRYASTFVEEPVPQTVTLRKPSDDVGYAR